MLSTVGSILQVTPWDILYTLRDQSHAEIIDDTASFLMRVSRRLEEKNELYGVCGPVLGDQGRFANLLCNLVVRTDNADWDNTTRCVANFKVGPGQVVRNSNWSYRHPNGTSIQGFPVYCSIGEVLETPDDCGVG